MAYVLSEVIHLIFHFLSYNSVDLESSPKIPFVTNLGISPSPKIVVKIIHSSYILFFFKQLDLGSILASLNLSLFVEFSFKHLLFWCTSKVLIRKERLQKKLQFISVQLRMLVYLVQILYYWKYMELYEHHDRSIEMWKHLKQSRAKKAGPLYRMLSVWLTWHK